MRLIRRPRRTHSYVENVLGTSLELQLVVDHDDAAQRAETAALEEVDRLSSILSGYVAGSELARWQTTLDCDAVVSAELAEVLDLAESWREHTHGAFNPAAVSLRVRLETGISSDDLLADLRAPLWSVDSGRGVARRLSTLPVSLDAIAKGYIVSSAAACARSIDGVSEVLLNIGGDIMHLGANSATIGIADPAQPAENAEPLAIVRIQNEALATSGGYRRGFMANDEWHSHIVDPRSGLPADDILSASVIAPDCATADALSTAFSVLAPAESLSLADSLAGVACLIVDSHRRVFASAAWTGRTTPVFRTTSR